jgi:CBS domain containing-hemolysin-like protein
MSEWLLAGAALLVLVVCARAEGAFALLNRARLRQLSGGPNRREQAVLELLAPSEGVIDDARVGVLAGAVVCASLATGWSARALPGTWGWLVGGFLAATLLAWLRLLGRAWGRRDAERSALELAGPMRLLGRLLGPLGELAHSAARALLALMGVRTERGAIHLGRPVLEELADRTEAEGAARADAGQVLQQVLDFGETTVEEVMIPRTEVVAVEVGTPVRAVVARIREHRFSRLPVYREDLDHIVGLVHQFDLFRARGPEQPVEELMRPANFVPESKKCDDLLREMQQSGLGMVVVLDEFGGTAGIVSLEDLLEELVGELGEEEAQRVTLRRVEAHAVVADGWVPIADLNEALGLDLPEGEYETLAGFVLEQLGRVPHRGEIVTGPHYRIEVLSADRRRIRSLRVERMDDPATHREGAPSA